MNKTSLIIAVSMLAVSAFAADDTKIALFNGKDFTGLAQFIPDKNADPATVWSVEDGVIRCTGSPRGYFRTKEQYGNYTLTFQWRWPGKGGNSGCLLHITGEDKVWPKSIESQLQSGQAADFWVIGGADFKEHTDPDNRRVLKKHKSSETPLGEWNTKKIVCAGNTIKVYVNGTLQNEATETTLEQGFIGFQSEGTSVEFRNIILQPLK